MNPPYGSKQLFDWCYKAVHEVYMGDALLVCALLPAKPEQEWWGQTNIAKHIQFIRGRLNFNGMKHNAQFPSVVVVWHRDIVR